MRNPVQMTVAFARSLALAAGLALASTVAFAQSAPTVILSNNATNNGSAMATTGGCSAGQTAVIFAHDNASRDFTTATDSTGANTWTAGTQATNGASRVQSWRSVLASAIVSGSTTIAVSEVSGTSQPSVIAQCYPSGTGFDVQGSDNGSTVTGTFTTNLTSPTVPVQYALAIFMSNRWNVVTGDPPTGWTASGTIIAGGTFGIKTYYSNQAASSSPSAALGNLSSTLAMASWVGVTYSAAAATGPPKLSLLGVGN